METNPKNDDKHNPKRVLRNIEDAYMFDAATGIYKPKTIETTQERARKQAGTNPRTRFFTDNRTDWRPIIVTSIVSLGTIALLIATVHYTRLQWVEMGKAAVSSKRAADDADKTLTKSEEFFKRDQRAYLYVRLAIETNGGFSQPPFNPASHIGVNFQVLNSGKTPANEEKHFALVSFQPSQKVDGENKAFEKAMRETQSLRLGAWSVGGLAILPNSPNSPNFFTVFSAVEGDIPHWTPAELEDLSGKSGNKRYLYAAGTIEYIDIFKEWHKTEFCWRWSVANSNWESCMVHNKVE